MLHIFKKFATVEIILRASNLKNASTNRDETNRTLHTRASGIIVSRNCGKLFEVKY